jgi:manganese/zinc/iron transport system substrate-binding protein
MIQEKRQENYSFASSLVEHIVKNFFLIAGCALLWGCSGGMDRVDHAGSWMESNGKLKVLSTTAMIDNLVAEIGQNYIDHIPLIIGEVDPHNYELVKGDDEKLSQAAVLFSNGLGLEHGASLRYRLKNHPAAVALGDEIEKENPGLILRSEREVDPHLWMDISLWSQAVAPIVQALSKADPEHADVYRQNGDLLFQKMQNAHQDIYRQLQQIPENKRYLVTSHDAFNYFTRAYLATPAEVQRSEWQKRFAAPEGLAPEGQLSVTDIQRIVSHLVRYAIGVIFTEANVNRDSLNKIAHACQSKGCHVRVSSFPLYADSMGPEGSEAGSYLGMIKYDADILEREWK